MEIVFCCLFSYMIYLAPLQGFTDFVYRKAYARIFKGVDAYFIPYISMKKDTILSKYAKEIAVINNPQARVIPQILPGNSNEMVLMAKQLKDIGYNEINLNLGCPYPMVTNRGKGSGLLPYPDKIESILTSYFEKWNSGLSVKLRAGLQSASEMEQIIPVLNKFPLKEVILHPRIAKQLYGGTILDETFLAAYKDLKLELVFNGDIFTFSDYKKRKQQFPATDKWMLGRGILMNPFLPSEINEIDLTLEIRREKLLDFHRLMLESYLEIMDNEGNALNKMKQFWFYFSYNFPNPAKALKHIKKSKNILQYKSEVKKIFYHLY
ncbi:tRNA-dihydrouridine synthase family protein [Prolixibacteraceae bacterium Z1-6]|uniref:tRNA-dihydrouridine synthase n=1 Tax=Draconibacterium aestuarii TaxID=2998507 RepID=A0A9X3F6N5_9BACT|nr:tRNA-dihydrouridine synthase family protein [Prolixibacteraceae bacterium Z1-6]